MFRGPRVRGPRVNACVCPLDTNVSRTKTDESIEVLFRV